VVGAGGGTEGEVYGTGVGGRDGGDAGREVYEPPTVAVGVGVARLRAAAYMCQACARLIIPRTSWGLVPARAEVAKYAPERGGVGDAEDVAAHAEAAVGVLPTPWLGHRSGRGACICYLRTLMWQ
jgi:hypothetical protein